jgi:choline-glycine betaine transporter
MNRISRRALPLAALPLLLAGCSTMKSVGSGLGILAEFALYLAAIALPFVLAYYLSKD